MDEGGLLIMMKIRALAMGVSEYLKSVGSTRSEHKNMTTF